MKETQNSKVKKKKPGETPARPFPQGLGGRCRAASRGGRQQPQGAWGRADQRAGHVGTQRTQPPAASHGDAAGHRLGLNTLDAAPAPSAGTALGHDPDARGPHRRRQQRRLPHQPETPQRPPKEQSCREHARATRTAGPPSARGAPPAPRASPAGAARFRPASRFRARARASPLPRRPLGPPGPRRTRRFHLEGVPSRAQSRAARDSASLGLPGRPTGREPADGPLPSELEPRRALCRLPQLQTRSQPSLKLMCSGEKTVSPAPWRCVLSAVSRATRRRPGPPPPGEAARLPAPAGSGRPDRGPRGRGHRALCSRCPDGLSPGHSPASRRRATGRPVQRAWLWLLPSLSSV